MKRSPTQREQDRADLLAALTDAAERPIKANVLVAAAAGYTLDAIPDRVLHVAWHRAETDLRALRRTGHLVMDTAFLATYTRVDLPDSDLAGRLAETAAAREDELDARGRWAAGCRSTDVDPPRSARETRGVQTRTPPPAPGPATTPRPSARA